VRTSKPGASLSYSSTINDLEAPRRGLFLRSGRNGTPGRRQLASHPDDAQQAHGLLVSSAFVTAAWNPLLPVADRPRPSRLPSPHPGAC